MDKIIYNKDLNDLEVIRDDSYDRQSLIETMMSFAESDKPQVGIWWLDKDNCDMFGIYSEDSNKIKPDSRGRVIYPKLHYQVWSKEHFRELAKRIPIDKQRFKGNYTMIERGRVNLENGKYIVYVGSWIKELEDIVTPLINLYFNISEFTYVVDEHWELGHGFSGDKFK